MTKGYSGLVSERARESAGYFLFVVKRDLSAIRDMLKIAYGWLIIGSKVRRRYRSHIENKSTYWIDQDEILR